MSTEEDSWDLQAAEYVLGTLSDDERKVYDTLYKVDSDWQRRVHAWQERLNPLHDSTPPVEAPARVLSAIMAHIHNEERLSATDADRSTSTPPIGSLPTGDQQDHLDSDYQADNVSGNSRVDDSSAEPFLSPALLNQWKDRVRYWQLTTLCAVASLVGVVVLGPSYLAKRAPYNSTVGTVAVLQGEAFEPLWAISYSPTPKAITGAASQGTVSVTVVGQPQLSVEQSHQLWMVLPDGAGVQSVGLVPNNPGETITIDLPIELSEAAEFAVSLEPLGGVPGPEHGPVVARTFIVEPATQTTL